MSEQPRVEASDPDDAAALAAMSAEERREALIARSEAMTQTVDVPTRRRDDGKDS